MSFGQVITAGRKEKGLSQKELAMLIMKEDGDSISPSISMTWSVIGGTHLQASSPSLLNGWGFHSTISTFSLANSPKTCAPMRPGRPRSTAHSQRFGVNCGTSRW